MGLNTFQSPLYVSSLVSAFSWLYVVHVHSVHCMKGFVNFFDMVMYLYMQLLQFNSNLYLFFLDNRCDLFHLTTDLSNPFILTHSLMSCIL